MKRTFMARSGFRLRHPFPLQSASLRATLWHNRQSYIAVLPTGDTCADGSLLASSASPAANFPPAPVRPTKETRAYHIGEPIELERVYSTSSEKKYGLNTSSQPSIEFSFSPSQGVVDLEALRWENGWAGSIIGGF